MKLQYPNVETKIEILKFIYQDQRSEVEYRREREHKIFTWSSNILLVLIGALMVTKQSETLVWKSYGIWGSVIVSAAVVLIVMYSLIWQLRTNKMRGQNAQVISRISAILHCFDKGFYDQSEAALFPDDWSSYGRNKVTFRRRLFTANYASAIFLLGIMALIMIWVS
jgi:hypothetical protein